jgi:very-short-patch-repair endonuclease
MSYKYNASLTGVAQALRKNMTPEEKHLWYDFLKHLPLTVNRQKTIGDFILDFFISEKRIAIEIDGIQHGEPSHKHKDLQRDNELRQLGIHVLRYSNQDINQRFDVVCADISKHLNLYEND